MRAGIYVRLSPRPDGNYVGTENQRKACQERADREGWTVDEVYKDDDSSASSGKPRPAYARMLTDIEAGRLDAIVAWHPDRLYRRPRDLEHLIDLCDAHRIAIRTVEAGDLDLSTPSGRFAARNLGSAARYEVEHKAERWKLSMAANRERGKPPGSRTRMFGWTRDLEVIPAEAEIVRWLAGQVIAGTSIMGLCRELNARGVSTAGGNQWKPTSLRKLLRNPRLAGHSTLRGEIVGRGAWEPILDEMTWQAVYGRLAARSKAPGPRVALLPGLIFCGLCETKLITGGRRRVHSHVDDKSGEWYRTYRCRSGPGMGGCGGISGDAAPIEDLVEGVARRRLSDPRIRRVIVEAQASGHEDVLADLDAEEQHLAQLEAALSDRGQSVPRVLRAIDTVTARIETLRRGLAAVAAVPIPDDIEIDWPTELGPRRRLVDLVVARVWLDRGTRGGRFDARRVRIDPTDAGRA